MNELLWFEKQEEHEEGFLYEVMPGPFVLCGIFQHPKDKIFERVERFLGYSCYESGLCACLLDDGIIVADMVGFYGGSKGNEKTKTVFYVMGVDESEKSTVRATIDNGISDESSGLGPMIQGKAYFFYGKLSGDAPKQVQKRRTERAFKELCLQEVFTTSGQKIYVAKGEKNIYVSVFVGDWLYFYVLQSSVNVSSESALGAMRHVEVVMKKEKAEYVPVRWAGTCRGQW